MPRCFQLTASVLSDILSTAQQGGPALRCAVLSHLSLKEWPESAESALSERSQGLQLLPGRAEEGFGPPGGAPSQGVPRGVPEGIGSGLRWLAFLNCTQMTPSGLLVRLKEAVLCSLGSIRVCELCARLVW